jgi:hypothetical protein
MGGAFIPIPPAKLSRAQIEGLVDTRPWQRVLVQLITS